MKKLTLLLALFLGAFQWAFAAPLKNIPVRLTQPDGQVIECFASGDEFYNYVHDANGFTFAKDKDGYYCYAIHDSKGEMVASTYRVNSVDPAKVGLQPYVKISEKAYQQRRHEREQHIKPIKRPKNREINHGIYNNLVVFIRFAGDTYHSTHFSTVDSMFNASNYESISLRNYFHHASYNQLDIRSYCYPEPDGETILSYEDDYPKEYYMPFDPVTNPLGYQEGENAEREFSLLERAIYYVADQVPDTLDLDYNDDGMVDNVVFVIKGQPGEWASLLWPHRWCIYDRYVPLNGLQVCDFNFQLEIGGYFNVSTLCHEMNHSLGAPDLYHYSDGPDPIGPWDLMGGTTEPPQQMSTYMKYKYGHWVDEIPVINPETDAFGTYELESVSWEGGRRNGYMIPLTNDQYFFVEYRDKNNIFESQIPGSGMLIYLIDTRFDGNAGWNGNDYLDEVYLFRPGGTPNAVGDLDHAYFSEESGRTSFNTGTDPHPFIHNQPYQFYDPGFEITNISRTGDRMTFDILPSPEGEGGGPLIENFNVHVNSIDHQLEFSWNAMPYADYYKLFCDGSGISQGITDTTFVFPYTEADNGYHDYSVMYVTGGMMHIYHAETHAWAILGNYETIHLSLSCESPYGTKGGELEVSFDHPQMPTQYFTIYEGSLKDAELYVPANTEVTFRWNPGFDPDSEGIHLMAKHFNENGEGTIFDLDRPQAGVVATYTVADSSLGLIAPNHLTATSDGQSIQLKWSMPTENHSFDIYRDGRKIASQENYDYLDDKFMRSGTHNYHVETSIGDNSSWNPDNLAYATAMNYYCEPPQNLEGTYNDGHVELSWEAPESVGQGMLAYDDNHFIEQVSKNKWGIKIEPNLLAHFAGHPLTHIEMFDCSSGHYTFTIYNGETPNNSTPLYEQGHDMEASHSFVKFALDEPVEFDPTLPLWICVSTSGVSKPIPCCNYVGESNSCQFRQGTTWKPAVEFGLHRSWLLRAYTSPIDGGSDFTYNVYWGPEEGGDEQLNLGYENLMATQASYNTTENQRYNVTAIWNGRETELSNTIYLGPSVGIEETAAQDNAIVAYPNPVSDQLTLQGEGLRHVSLISITGATVFDSDINGDEFVIDMERMPQGLYLLWVCTDEGVKVEKVVKR